MTKGEHTNERTYVRDRPYIPSTTLLCEGVKRKKEKLDNFCGLLFASLDDETLPKKGQLLKKKISLRGANSFLKELTVLEQAAKSSNGRDIMIIYQAPLDVTSGYILFLVLSTFLMSYHYSRSTKQL